MGEKTAQQQALEKSELWKLYEAIKRGEDHGVLLNLAREANAEFCRMQSDQLVAG
jgi:hypothetical protein